MSLTTKNIATAVLGVAMVVSTFAFAAPAQAQTVADLQAMINQLLAQVAALQGGNTPVVGGTCNTFTKNHQMGDTGGEVMWIQQFLNKNGMTVAATGAGSPGNESSYFGAKTRAAIAKWQASVGITPAAGYWGPITRAKANSMCVPGTGTGTGGTPVTGNGLKVMLAAGSPNNVALVQGQSIGELARFEFQNPTGSEITVTSIGFNRIGVSNDSTLTNVYLYEGAVRLTDSASISNTAFNFNESAGIFKIPAGGKKVVSVRSDIAAGSNGQQVGASLVSVGTTATLDSSVVFPIAGGLQTVSAATLANVDFSISTSPSATSLDPQNDFTVWQNTLNIGTRAVNLESVSFENLGSNDADDVKNFRLYVDGTQVGAAVAMADANDMVTFDLSASPKRMETGGRVVKLVADVVGGSGETIQFSLRRASDIRAIDTELNQPVLARGDADSTTDPYSAHSATSATINSGTVSVVKAGSSPNANVSLNAAAVKWATFEMRASGENVKVDNLNVDVAVSSSADGLDNGKVFLNGVQVGSTKDLPEAGDTNFTFGSSFILRQGMTEVVDIYADAKDDDGGTLTSGETVTITISAGSSNGEGRDSKTTSNVPGAAVAGNPITVSSSSLSATKYSGYGNQTMIAGTNNARIGSFTLSAGSTEGVNINTIRVDLSSANSASITDLRLVDNSNGAAIGTTKASPSSENSYAVNFDIAQSGTKTIDVYANIKSSANPGTIIATVDSTTGGTGKSTGNSTTVGSDLTLQTITLGSGTLTVSRDPGTPVNSNVIAGANMVHVGKFDFDAQNSSFTVQELMVKVPADAATSVSNVTLKYKNQAGVEQTVSQALALSSGSQTHATATFTGLTFYIPLNDSADVDVYVDVPTTTSGAKSGAAVSVVIDNNNGFKAVDGAGTQTTSYTTEKSSNDSSGYGTKYVKKSVPVLARLSTGYTANTVSTGTGLYRFTVTADAAGSIEWRELSFNVTTSGDAATLFSAFQLYDVTGTATQIGANTATNAAGTLVSFCPGTSCTIGEAEQIGAGSSKTYEIRATVADWDSGDSIAISFAEDTSAATNAAAASLHSGQNFVWSDRSAASHTTATTDWTNGYLVKDMDNDTRSCQISTNTTCTP